HDDDQAEDHDGDDRQRGGSGRGTEEQQQRGKGGQRETAPELDRQQSCPHIGLLRGGHSGRGYRELSSFTNVPTGLAGHAGVMTLWVMTDKSVMTHSG